MKKIIDPGREPVIHYYCDGCGELVEHPDSCKEYSVQFIGNFGFNSPADGFIFNHSYCGDCGMKAVEAIESALKIKIEQGDNIRFMCDSEDFKEPEE